MIFIYSPMRNPFMIKEIHVPIYRVHNNIETVLWVVFVFGGVCSVSFYVVDSKY